MNADNGNLHSHAHWQLCQQFDALDDRLEDKIGGPTAEQDNARDALETRILNQPPTCAETRAWFTKRLVRGVQNGWSEEWLRPYALALGLDDPRIAAMPERVEPAKRRELLYFIDAGVFAPEHVEAALAGM